MKPICPGSGRKITTDTHTSRSRCPQCGQRCITRGGRVSQHRWNTQGVAR